MKVFSLLFFSFFLVGAQAQEWSSSQTAHQSVTQGSGASSSTEYECGSGVSASVSQCGAVPERSKKVPPSQVSEKHAEPVRCHMIGTIFYCY